MDPYLERFRHRLGKYEGSLLRVASVSEPHAKEYLSKLARQGAVERVDWGWYYVPSRTPPRTPFEFLAQDRNFKVVTRQSAASLWNADFIHRDIVTVAVEDLSYGRALEALARRHGWKFSIDYNPEARDIPMKRIGGLRVEDRGQTVIDCIKRWAFVDALATMAAHREVRWDHVARDAYWLRISRSDVRVGQALEYVTHGLFHVGGEIHIRDDFVRRQLDEAIEKVREFE